jgi:hypothetical protein
MSTGSRITERGAALVAIEAGLEDGIAEADTPLVLDKDRATVHAETILRSSAATRERIALVGDGGDGSRYGGSLGIALGSSNIGVVGPFATYAPTDVIVARNGSNFTGGQVRLAALLLLPALAI